MQEFSDQMPRDLAVLPMVPIRDVVIFPFTKVAFKIGRPSSVRALEMAMEGERTIFLATQHDAAIDDPSVDQIYRFGTVGRILQAQKQENGQIKVVVEGRERGESIRIDHREDGVFIANVRKIKNTDETGSQTDGWLQVIHGLIEQLMRVAPDAYTDALHSSLRIGGAAQVADSLGSHLRITVSEKQSLLENSSVAERLAEIAKFLEIEIEKKQIDRNVQARTKKQMDKQQREYYLNEQIKAIHKELGRKDEKAEIENLRKKVEGSGMNQEAMDKALAEITRLESMPPLSAESSVSRTYIEWLLNVPWTDASEEIEDIVAAETVLDDDHFGLEKIKDRILEHLAVRKLVSNPKGTILCFVGAPGVGKTSLGQSIAKATGRKFMRLALGGVHDEAEIRGHRRTYVGALPGQIIQLMKRAGTVNPVILLDEVDKIGKDHRGDPSAALLEVLDPEQNSTFRDHYLDVEYDLSKVFFIATANVLHTIPSPLLDRLEILNLSGYTEREKLEIAKKHLVSKQAEGNGFTTDTVDFTDDGLLEIIRHYTREAGVRNLERQIGACFRKLAREFVSANSSEAFKKKIDAQAVGELLGPILYRNQDIARKSEIGLVNGLAWTQAGGDVLQIEATLVPGKGGVTLTGKLGEVMQESARAGLTCVRSRAERLGLKKEDFTESDLHIHVPEGAIPKDGPSAGITMAVAIVSAMTKRRIRHDVAMTGEITLRGNVLPVGGIKEKLLAAHRYGLKTVLLSEQNQKDLVDVPDEIKEDMNIVFVRDLDEVVARVVEDSASDGVDGGSNLWAANENGGELSVRGK